MYESKVVDMTQRVVSGAAYLVAHNPGPNLLAELIAEYKEQDWEVVSVDIKQDSGWWIFSNNDESTHVTFKRERKDRPAAADEPILARGVTCFGALWEKEGRPGATQDKSGKWCPKGFNTWDPTGYRRQHCKEGKNHE